jgi:anti-sigma regulatory factor (Ser/Thr protein kinase)
MTGTVAARRTDAPAVSIRLPAEAESLMIVRQAVTGVAEALGIGDQRRDDMRIAVSEACTNVVVHAYPDAPGELLVGLWADAGGLVIRVTDAGQGIVPDPLRQSPGLGIGLQLMATLADDMHLSTPDGGGTEVVLTFLTAG